MKGLNKKEEGILITLLAKLSQRKSYSREVFEALSRTSPRIAIEAVALRKREGVIEVFLTRRPPDDVYANLLHVPGTIIRNKEKFTETWERLEEEFRAPVVSEPKLVEVFNNLKERRGHFISLVFACEISGEPATGKFFPIANLPDDLIDHHRPMIIAAAEAWTNNRYCSVLANF